jgi:hypothetical protein
MTNPAYLIGRKQWNRPQAMLWSDTAGTIVDGFYVPTGYEKNSDPTDLTETDLADSFIILSDHNRAEISISHQRLEQRKRMINGTMRSYHIADKITMSTSWSMLPSRAFADNPNFNQSNGGSTPYSYTADGGAGGVELLDWYETHKGPFWVFLSYDKYNNFGSDSAAYDHLTQYSQIIQMYISAFDYSIVKRGSDNHDYWNVSVTLEQV